MQALEASVAQSEVMLAQFAAEIARASQGQAERQPADWPWGVYRCAGEDEWCVVTVRGDKDWQDISVDNVSRMALGDVFADIDVLLAPSTIGEAPTGIEATGDPLFNRIWTLLRTPCVHVPFGRGPSGLPVGVTIVGPIGADRATLLAADWIHAKLGGADIEP